MSIIVWNCFDWIGFHITEKLLEEGEDVIGIHPVSNPQTEFLYGMVGRNANFTFYESLMEVKDKTDEYIFVRPTEEDENQLTKSIEKENYLYIIEETEKKSKNFSRVLNGSISTISLPPVIGPWMKEEEFQAKKDSEDWIYVKEFTDWFHSFMQTSCKKEEVNLLPKNSFIQEKDRNTIVFTDNLNRRSVVKEIEEHLEKFSFYYDIKGI
ncbi:hypothetical protein HNQ94_001480 [Salirhabdus euzebyi]|uniref:Uncharacterized protein n=1 Tax=Salirhabdus euzebyi TaxID=394506 RepID=A0A841Q3T8_9BACI|nr:NAD(P)-dependent oxidoreductase [Salirhabdus euzebyi]MBB6453032.1 hypothetical protein [Salirhabdus euzebyi]